MALIKFRDTVVTPKVVFIACAVINAANSATDTGSWPTMVVTSGNDSVHMAGSKHYTDEALDFQTKTLTTSQKYALLVAVRTRLGPDYVAILEDEGQPNEHMHCQYGHAKK